MVLLLHQILPLARRLPSLSLHSPRLLPLIRFPAAVVAGRYNPSQEVESKEQAIEAKMASLQKEMADGPMLMLATKEEEALGESSNGNANSEFRVVLDAYTNELGEVMEEADSLRIWTVRKIATEVLTSRQAAEFLVAGKKLHLKVHEWGLTRDLERGRGGGE